MSDPWAKALHHYDDADDEEYAAGTADGYNAALAAVRPDYDRVVAERDDLARRLAEAEAELEKHRTFLAEFCDNAVLDPGRRTYRTEATAELVDALVAQREGGQ